MSGFETVNRFLWPQLSVAEEGDAATIWCLELLLVKSGVFEVRLIWNNHIL